MKNESQYLKPMDWMRLAAFCQIALTTLNARLLTGMALLSATALFAWVLYQPDYLRLAGACAYALLVLWPLQRLDMRDIAAKAPQGEEP